MKEFLPLVGSKKEIKKYKAFGILLLILILAVSVSSVLGNTIGPWLLGDTSGGGTIDGSTDNSTDNTSNDCDQGAIDTKRAELEAALALLQEQITNAEAEVPDLRADILKDEEALREIENWLSGNAAWIKGLLSEMDLAYDELSRHVADGNTQAASETRSYIAELRSEVSEREETLGEKPVTFLLDSDSIKKYPSKKVDSLDTFSDIHLLY
jgi:F0F1-type ATP synthase membrane subunit b/b'